jgi:nucleoside-diphosphate-sugar epimerase
LAWGIDGGGLVDFAQTNVLGSLKLMAAARRADAGRFVYISTCAVHDIILDDRPLDEAHPLWPRSHYGAHKAAIEKFVHSYGLGEAWPICSLRPTGIYGIARPFEKTRWLNIVREVVAGKPIRSAAGGKEVHAVDVAKAVELLLAAPADQIAGQSFNCYDRYIAEQDVAQVAKEIVGSRSEIEMLNKGPKHQIDTSKLQRLGMRFGGEALLRETVGQAVDNLNSASD